MADGTANNGTPGQLDDADRNIEMWKVKKLIKSLQMARGNGTSMISLIVPVRTSYFGFFFVRAFRLLVEVRTGVMVVSSCIFGKDLHLLVNIIHWISRRLRHFTSFSCDHHSLRCFASLPLSVDSFGGPHSSEINPIFLYESTLSGQMSQQLLQMEHELAVGRRSTSNTTDSIRKRRIRLLNSRREQIFQIIDAQM